MTTMGEQEGGSTPVTAETIAELLDNALEQMDCAAKAAATVKDEVTRHEIAGHILGAYGVVESVLGKVTNEQGQSAGCARKRLALLGRGYVPGDPEAIGAAAARLLDRARRAAEARP